MSVPALALAALKAKTALNVARTARRLATRPERAPLPLELLEEPRVAKARPKRPRLLPLPSIDPADDAFA
jgi:hypothetical protein